MNMKINTSSAEQNKVPNIHKNLNLVILEILLRYYRESILMITAITKVFPMHLATMIITQNHKMLLYKSIMFATAEK